MVLLVLALGALVTPTVQRDGWEFYAPPVVLAAWLPQCKDPADRATSLLAERLQFEERRWGESESEGLEPIGDVTAWVLARSCAAILDDKTATPTMTEYALLALEALKDRSAPAVPAIARYIDVAPERDLWSAMSILKNARRVDPAVPALARRLEPLLAPGSNSWVATTIIELLAMADQERPAAVRALRTALAAPEGDGWPAWDSTPVAAVIAIGQLGGDAREAVPDLLAYADRPVAEDSSEVIGDNAAKRLPILIALGQIDREHEGVRDFIATSLLTREVSVTQEAARLAMLDQTVLDRFATMLPAELAAEDAGRRARAAHTLALLESSDTRLRPLLERGAADPNPVVRRFTARALRGQLGAWPEAAGLLEVLADDTDLLVSDVARRLLQEKGRP